MKTPIPISATHAEARTLLEERHPIEYRDSMMGVTTHARCRCGWRSPEVNAGYIAQAAAKRHLAVYVEYPLEQRRRFAIYREACDICLGAGEVSPEAWAAMRPDARPVETDAECSECWAGYVWTIRDREDGSEKYAGTQQEALELLYDDLRYNQEPTA